MSSATVDRQGRVLINCSAADFAIEQDHGIPILQCSFDAGDSSGWGGFTYYADVDFLMGFLRAVGVRRLSEVKGRKVWFVLDEGADPDWFDLGKVARIDPLHPKDGKPFDIRAWQAEKKAEYELRKQQEVVNG